jgi:phenylalanyl-tRNA synthetase beta chain
MGLMSANIMLGMGIKKQSVILFEIDYGALESYSSRNNEFHHLPLYPMTDYDISILVNSDVKWSDINDVCKSVHDANIHDVRFIEEYAGKQVPAGKKSIMFRLLIGSTEKTLTSAEIDASANAIIKKLADKLGATLR